MAINYCRDFLPGTFHKELILHGRWLRQAGTLLFLIGMLQVIIILFPFSLQNKIIGTSFIFASLIIFTHSFLFWKNKIIGLMLHLSASFIYLIAGVLVLQNDTSKSVMQLLTIFLLIGYILMGIFRVKISLVQQRDDIRWKWTALAGAANILIILFILSNKLLLEEWQMNLLISIDLIFSGVAILILGI